MLVISQKYAFSTYIQVVACQHHFVGRSPIPTTQGIRSYSRRGVVLCNNKNGGQV